MIPRVLLCCAALAVLSACETPVTDKTVDTFIGTKNTRDLRAGIWVDPNGCDHWIIDDGLEGYLSQRLDRHGRPVCSGFLPGGVALGDYGSREDINDDY